jgi:hypothetical protein
MRERTHVTLATGLLVIVALACHSPRTTTVDAGDVDASAEAAKLSLLLPATLGPFTATGSPMTTTGSGNSLIEAQRSYDDASGKKLMVKLETGDLRPDIDTIESNDENAFGSDSPTYWRTTSVAGHRTRIAEERPVVHTSECLVYVEPNHIATVRVYPASAGECAAIAALLDFKAILANGGVPGPRTSRR